MSKHAELHFDKMGRKQLPVVTLVGSSTADFPAFVPHVRKTARALQSPEVQTRVSYDERGTLRIEVRIGPKGWIEAAKDGDERGSEAPAPEAPTVEQTSPVTEHPDQT